MVKLFVSYSRADYVDENGQILVGSPVDAIVEVLNATNNIDVWIDVNSKYSGKYFTNVLAKKILWADKVLFLSSRNSNSSEWVSKEILFAHDNKKEILPVRLDDSCFNLDYTLVLTGIDYIDYYINPKGKTTDIIENILDRSQELADDIANGSNTDNDSTQHFASSQRNGNKGSLNLNAKYKGCAITMTILLGVLFIIGVFMPPLKDETDNNGVLAINVETSRIPNDRHSPENRFDSDAQFLPTTSQPQIKEETSKPSRRKRASNHTSTIIKDSTHISHQSASNDQTLIAQRTDIIEAESSSDSTRNVTGEEIYIAQNNNEQKIERPTAPPISTGALGGPRSITDRVAANSSDAYNVTFKGGELAVLMVMGDGDTDLDVFVYDSKGNLVASDTDSTDDCVIKWTPRWTDKYRVVIKNKGNVYNLYTIRTNQ